VVHINFLQDRPAQQVVPTPQQALRRLCPQPDSWSQVVQAVAAHQLQTLDLLVEPSQVRVLVITIQPWPAAQLVVQPMLVQDQVDS
jgi:hypothetical protein